MLRLMNGNTTQGRSKPHRLRKGKAPRYRAVTEALRRQLTDGSLAAGVKLPALRDLADQFKVSTNTVRNAIRVLEHEGSLYHVPDVGAFVRPTYPSRTATDQVTIALATIDIGGAFEMAIARGIEQGCQHRGWGLQIYDAQIDAERELRNLSRLAESGTRGAIILPISDHANLEALVKLKLANYPMVLVDRSVPGLKVDLVESDHEKGAYQATEHLLKHGHKRIVMVTDHPTAMSVSARIRGFDRALLDYGIEPTRDTKVWIDGEQGVRGIREGRRWFGGFDAVMPVLKNLNGPIAIFAHNDYSVWGVFEACRELHLRVPDQVSIVGFDDSDITRATTPPITTIAQRPMDIGRTALELLERRLQPGGNDVEPQHILIDIELIKRKSVAPPMK